MVTHQLSALQGSIFEITKVIRIFIRGNHKRIENFTKFLLCASVKLQSVLLFSFVVAACGGGGGNGVVTGTATSIKATATTVVKNLTIGTAMASFSPLAVSGGTPPYTYNYSGTLPSGLIFDASNGTVTGIPTAIYATANLVFSVRDKNGAMAKTTSTISFTVGAVPNNPISINDTGINSKQCYQAGSDILVSCSSAEAFALSNSQDGMIGRDGNATSNSNIDGIQGFSFTSVAGGCVQDNVTGLMWEVKTADGGLQDWGRTFTNNGDNRAGDTSTYQAAVNATNLCGYNDWRTPANDELQSIVDYSVVYPGPTIDSNWFPNSRGNWFWSATPYAGGYPGTWGVNFYLGITSYGSDLTNPSIFTHYVRLVRGGLSPITPRYTVSANGQEITDNQTKLIWRRCAEGLVYDGVTCTGIVSWFSHELALLHAKEQANSSGLDWRLPNIKELSSITNISLINPAIAPLAFPATPTTTNFWSSSPYISCPCDAWSVYFYNGSVTHRNRSSSNYVRLVRVGQ